MPTCTHCGSESPQGNKECLVCGAPFEAETVTLADLAAGSAVSFSPAGNPAEQPETPVPEQQTQPYPVLATEPDLPEPSRENESFFPEPPVSGQNEPPPSGGFAPPMQEGLFPPQDGLIPPEGNLVSPPAEGFAPPPNGNFQPPAPQGGFAPPPSGHFFAQGGPQTPVQNVPYAPVQNGMGNPDGFPPQEGQSFFNQPPIPGQNEPPIPVQGGMENPGGFPPQGGQPFSGQPPVSGQNGPQIPVQNGSVNTSPTFGRPAFSHPGGPGTQPTIPTAVPPSAPANNKPKPLLFALVAVAVVLIAVLLYFILREDPPKTAVSEALATSLSQPPAEQESRPETDSLPIGAAPSENVENQPEEEPESNPDAIQTPEMVGETFSQFYLSYLNAINAQDPSLISNCSSNCKSYQAERVTTINKDNTFNNICIIMDLDTLEFSDERGIPTARFTVHCYNEQRLRSTGAFQRVNTAPHRVTAKYDESAGEWYIDEVKLVENLRLGSNQQIILSDSALMAKYASEVP